MKPRIVFFSRDYQTKLFPLLQSDKYESFFVTLTIKEKRQLLTKNIPVSFCFEEEYNELNPSKTDQLNNLETSFFSDRYFCKYDIVERNNILAKEFAFWDKVFKFLNPTFLINEVIAIEIAEVMYLKAKEYNIEYLAWMVSPFPDKFFYWLTNPFHASLDQNIFSLVPSPNSLIIAEKYMDTFLSSINSKPFYAKNLNSRFSFMNNIKITGRYFRSYLKRIGYTNNNLSNGLLDEYYGLDNSTMLMFNLTINSYLFSYNNIEKLKDFELVFYPLHYEPEASIIYFSEFNEDQPALIRNLSKCLKRNQLLVVKEHPQQPGMLLSKEYRILKKRLSNVAYLPAEFSTKELILQSKIVITQTSTAGWEAILLGKPVFVLGKVFYDKYKNINKFFGFEKLREALLHEDYLYPKTDDTLKYISLFWDYCEFGNPYPNPDLYLENNLCKIITAIEKKVMQKAP